MFIRDYLRNPLGKGVAMYPARQMFQEYKDRYNTIAMDIRYRIYFINDKYYFHFRIPSKVDEITYDVVIEFHDNGKSINNTILDWDFRVFSNCPSFVFTYAYAYNKKDMLIKDLDKKFTNAAAKMPSNVRNPYKITGYEFSVFMALYHIMQRRVYLLSYLNEIALKPGNMTPLIRDIQDMDSILKRRKAKEMQMKESERRQRILEEQEAKRLSKIENDNSDNKVIKTDRKIVNTAKKSATVKKVNTVKKIKKR